MACAVRLSLSGPSYTARPSVGKEIFGESEPQSALQTAGQQNGSYRLYRPELSNALSSGATADHVRP